MSRSYTASTDRVTGAMGSAIDSGGWTLGAWIYPTALTPDHAQIVHVGSGSNGRMQLKLNPEGGSPQGFSVTAVFVGNEIGARTASGVLTTNAWQCVVGAHSGDTSDAGDDFCFLGDLDTPMFDATATTSGATGTRATGGTDVYVGHFPGFNIAFPGRLAHVFCVPWQMSLAEAEEFRQGNFWVLWRRAQPRFYLPLAGAGLYDLAGSGGNYTVVSGTTTAEDPPVLWNPGTGIRVERQPTVAGSTLITGALVKQTNKNLAGGVTPSGTLTKQLTKSLAGAVTPSGALSKQTSKSLAGSITPSGTVARAFLAAKSLAGSLTPTGALVKQTAKNLAGSTTPTGALTKAVATSLAGSITPTGALVRRTAKNLAGAVTPTGALSKAVTRLLGGSLTPTGALSKQVSKGTAGTVTPTGSLTKSIAKLLSGTVTSSGTLTRLVGKSLAGAITPTGSVTKAVSKMLGGSVTPTGDLTAESSTVQTVDLGGTVTPTGSLTVLVLKSLGGSITPSGLLTKQAGKGLSATQTSTGSLSKQVGKALAGTVPSSGTVNTTAVVLVNLGGSVTPSGTVTLRLGKSFAGALQPSGALVALFIPGSGAGFPGTVEVEVEPSALVTVDVVSQIEVEQSTAFSVTVSVQAP